jgi:hypothetical protein
MTTDASTADGTRLLTRRLRELTVRRARLRRRVEVAGNAAHLGGVDAEIARLGNEIDHRRNHLAIVASTGSYQPWSHDHFRLGDFARIGGTWYPVLRVGWTALTVPPLELLGERRYHPNPERGVDTDDVAYFRVYGRRRAGRVLHTPPPPEAATCTCRVIIPTFNAEFVPEQDAGPCTEPPVARLTIRHDGDSCGCHGLCLLADPDSANSALRAPWVEVVLFCHTHAYEHAATADSATETAAITFEELT